MHISKHHYATELARAGNNVFFLNPPNPTLPEKVSITPLANVASLSVVTYRPPFPFRLRFHARWLFDLLMGRFLRRLTAHLPTLDLVWCFDFNLYTNLRAFGASQAIYHPVDPVTYQYQIQPAKSADLVLSVSQKILDCLSCSRSQCHLVGHGLSTAFDTPLDPLPDAPPLRFGYAGNLLRPQIDHAALRAVIESNPEVRFIFWGAHIGCRSNLSIAEEHVSDDVHQFNQFLSSSPNVTLRGAVSPEQLAVEMRDVHGFLLAYKADDHVTDNSNSHKILEYLSTGQVVVSYPIDHYLNPDRIGLLRMTGEPSADEFAAVFSETVKSLPSINSSEQRQQRHEYAVANSYANHLNRISSLIFD